MKAIVLVDNAPHPERNLNYEHGLSIYFEADGYKWLLDVGASGKFAANAVVMGIDPTDIDYLILSHGHSDHTGGLSEFFKLNNKAKIYISPFALNHKFISFKRDQKRDISIDHTTIEPFKTRFLFAVKNTQLTKNVALICQIPSVFSKPKANQVLFRSDSQNNSPDTFEHEMALAVKTDSGVVVFSGCSHNGLLNILTASSLYFDNAPVSNCIGGTHLIDSDENNHFETDMEIKIIASLIKTRFPNMKLVTGHCSGTHAKKILTKELGSCFETFYTGWMADIN